MGKKVRISDESVNCYGTRILTSGIDFSQYAKNPVLLYMHDRSNGVVGVVKGVGVENGELVGELEFDCASELSQRLKKQYEFGSMRMVSGNFQVLETSDDKSLAMPGQTAQTITRCRLFEVSAVDIGGNDNAIVLSSPDGKEISLINNPLIQKVEMELKTLALSLGLAETATEAECSQKIEALKLANAKVAGLETQVTNLQKAQGQMQLAAVAAVVDTAIQEKRIAATKKDHFVELGKKLGADELKSLLLEMQPQAKLSAALHRSDGGQVALDGGDFSKFEKLSAVPGSMMDDLIDNHQSDYIRLFKAEYGVEPASL